METIVFGGGCFWCTEAVFKMMNGIASVLPGYAGGHTKNPTYAEVSTGTTGHAEAVKIKYDPKLTNLESLLEIYFASHDPTQVNRQGNDVGTQYRSVIFYTNEGQKAAIIRFIAILQLKYGERKIVTEIKPLGAFYPAEEEHLDFFGKNPNQPYCMFIIRPKVEKIREEFGAK